MTRRKSKESFQTSFYLFHFFCVWEIQWWNAPSYEIFAHSIVYLFIVKRLKRRSRSFHSRAMCLTFVIPVMCCTNCQSIAMWVYFSELAHRCDFLSRFVRFLFFSSDVLYCCLFRFLFVDWWWEHSEYKKNQFFVVEEWENARQRSRSFFFVPFVTLMRTRTRTFLMDFFFSFSLFHQLVCVMKKVTLTRTHVFIQNRFREQFFFSVWMNEKFIRFSEV